MSKVGFVKLILITLCKKNNLDLFFDRGAGVLDENTYFCNNFLGVLAQP